MEAVSLPFNLSGSIILVVVLGIAAQLSLLGLWHRIRPWWVVLIRTLIVQVLVVLAASVLIQRWPFSFPHKYAGIDLAFVIAEGLLIIWYLLQPRGRSHLEVDGERY